MLYSLLFLDKLKQPYLIIFMHFCFQFSVKRCKVCPLTFLTKSEMQIHSKSHTEAKPHKCPHCSKTFANASYLSQHLRIHLGIKPYHCSYCENSFRQLSHLQQHTRSVQLWTRSSLVRSGVRENKIVRRRRSYCTYTDPFFLAEKNLAANITLHFWRIIWELLPSSSSFIVKFP